MGDSTRASAPGKLSAFAEKIGYADTWRDYSVVSVARDPHYANRLSARELMDRRIEMT